MPEQLKESGTTEEKRIERIKKWWTITENAYNPWAVQAQEDLNFYLGGERQWLSTDLEKLKAENRPALTYNHLLSLINLISGYQRQNRQDIKIFNRKGGTKAVAEILTEIIKHIHDNCYGDWEASMQFLMGIITGIGWLGININYDDDMVNGDIVLENISPFRVYPDPYFERYDLSDAQFIFKTAWLPKSRIELIFPEKKEELDGLDTVDTRDKQLIPYAEGDRYHDAGSTTTGMTEIEKYRYRVKECWHKELEVVKLIVGLESGIVKPVDWPDAKIKALMKMNSQLRYIKRVKPVMHLTTSVGDVELQYTKDPMNGVTRYPLIPFFAYWLENQHFGVITQLKDPQREINKRRSQVLHHLNQSANSGWIADDNAMTDWTVLEDFGGKPGIIIKKKSGSHLERISATSLSEGHLTLAREGKQDIRDVSGINQDLAGVPSQANQSGYLMELRRNQGLVATESIHDNFKLTQQILGRTLIDVIQKSKAYSKEEILSLVIDGKVKEISINSKEEATGRILNDMTIGKYGVVVSQSPSSPTVRNRNMMTLVEAVKAGMPIPPDILIDASDLPMKDEIKTRMREHAEKQQLSSGAPQQ